MACIVVAALLEMPPLGGEKKTTVETYEFTVGPDAPWATGELEGVKIEIVFRDGAFAGVIADAAAFRNDRASWRVLTFIADKIEEIEARYREQASAPYKFDFKETACDEPRVRAHYDAIPVLIQGLNTMAAMSREANEKVNEILAQWDRARAGSQTENPAGDVLDLDEVF